MEEDDIMEPVGRVEPFLFLEDHSRQIIVQENFFMWQGKAKARILPTGDTYQREKLWDLTGKLF